MANPWSEQEDLALIELNQGLLRHRWKTIAERLQKQFPNGRTFTQAGVKARGQYLETHHDDAASVKPTEGDESACLISQDA